MITKLTKELLTIITSAFYLLLFKFKKRISLIKKIFFLIYNKTKSKTLSTLLLPFQYRMLPFTVTLIISITIILALNIDINALPTNNDSTSSLLLKIFATAYLFILIVTILATFISLVRHLFFKINFVSYYSILVEFIMCYSTLFILFRELDKLFFPNLNQNFYFEVAPIYESYFLQFAYVHFVLFAIFLVILSIFITIITPIMFTRKNKRILIVFNYLIHQYLSSTILLVFIIIGIWITTYYTNTIYKIMIFNKNYENELIKSTEIFLFDRDSVYYRNILTALCILPIFKIIKNQFFIAKN